VGFVEIESDKGHDSFLLNVPDFLETLGNFLNTSYERLHEKRFKIISNLIEKTQEFLMLDVEMENL